MIAELLTCNDAPGLMFTIQEHRLDGVDVIELLDKRSGFPLETARALFDLAMKCTASRDDRRPSMQDVLTCVKQYVPVVCHICVYM